MSPAWLLIRNNRIPPVNDLDAVHETCLMTDYGAPHLPDLPGPGDDILGCSLHRRDGLKALGGIWDPLRDRGVEGAVCSRGLLKFDLGGLLPVSSQCATD
jgi:hypothetical protein